MGSWRGQSLGSGVASRSMIKCFFFLCRQPGYAPTGRTSALLSLSLSCSLQRYNRATRRMFRWKLWSCLPNASIFWMVQHCPARDKTTVTRMRKNMTLGAPNFGAVGNTWYINIFLVEEKEKTRTKKTGKCSNSWISSLQIVTNWPAVLVPLCRKAIGEKVKLMVVCKLRHSEK